MKSRHIIAIGLLSATAVALLGIAMAKNNKKPKTLQTKAESNNNIIYTNTNQTENIITYQNALFQQVKLHITQKTTTYLFTVTEQQTKYQYSINLQYYYETTYNNNLYKVFYNSLNTPFNNTAITNEITTIEQNNTTITTTIRKPMPIEVYVNHKKITYTNLTTTNNSYIVDTNNNQVADYQKPSILLTLSQGTSTTNETINTETLTYNTNDVINTISNQTYTNGYTQGETTGYQTGYTEGETTGYQTGYTEGETTGYNTGYNNGYGSGYADAGIYNEVIDLRGTMLQILTMPFTFITQAFDVTIFPNTPYEFNFSRLIMGILAISAILFIIKLFTSGLAILGNYTNNNKDIKTDREYKRSQIDLNNAKTEKIKKSKK